MIKLSIITINLNNCTGLLKTVKSVINQTYNNFEFIVIDGNSSDDSKSLLAEYNSKIFYWISEADTGRYNAMNKGILKANGEYCLFLNSGDYLYNNHILQEVFALNFNEDIITGDIIKFSDSYSFNEVFSKINHSDITFYDLYRYSLNHQATFIKRKLFFDYGFFDEHYSVISDWIFTVKTLGLGSASFKYINKVISYYDNDGISNSNYNYIDKERTPALIELLPARILKDYEDTFNDDFLKTYKRLNNYKLTSFILKALNYLVCKYETAFNKAKSK